MSGFFVVFYQVATIVLILAQMAVYALVARVAWLGYRVLRDYERRRAFGLDLREEEMSRSSHEPVGERY